MADFDAGIRAELENDETFQGIMANLKAVAFSEVWVRDDTPCAKCSCKHIRMVKVPDIKTQLQTMEFMANRGVGRPGQTEEGDSEKITFERIVEWGCQNCSCESCLKDRGESPSA